MHLRRALSTTACMLNNATLTSAFKAVGATLPVTTSTTLLPSLLPTTKKTNKPPILSIPPAQDPLLEYLVSTLTKRGKRHQATRQISTMLLHVHAFTREPALPILRNAIIAASPAVKCVTMSTGSKKTLKPTAIGERERTKIGVSWILEAAKKRPGRTISEKLAREVVGIVQDGEGNSVVEKKKKMHVLAMVNRGTAKDR